MVVLVAAVLDIVQLGLYFPVFQAQHGRGQSESTTSQSIDIIIVFAAQPDHTWQLAAA